MTSPIRPASWRTHARRSPEQRRWVLDRIRAYLAAGGAVNRGAFVEAERGRGATKADLADCGGWRAVVREAQAAPVDFSALDFDDDDTRPGGFPIAEPEASPTVEPTRAPEPRELLALERSKAEAAELKRRLSDALEALHHADERAGIVGELRAAPDPSPILRREVASGMREATAVVLASDWHVEEVVNPRAIDDLNAYGPDIARARAERMTAGILWLLAMHRGRFQIRDLVLWLGGDLISGYLHEELEETNALSPIQAVLLAHEIIAGMIATLLERSDVERLIIPCCVGNHGRSTRKTRSKTRVQNSYEYLLYRNLEDRFRNEPRVEFTIAGGTLLYHRVYEQTIRFHHGDDVRYWGGVGGVTIPLNKAIAAWNTSRHADLTCIGHFHQLLSGRDFQVNGSLVGYSEFALTVKASYEPPRQAFFLMDSKRGRCCSTPLWVDGDEEAEAWRAA